MNLIENMMGRLGIEALPQDLITQVGAVGMVLGGLGVVAALFYFKKWTWLWRNWLTTWYDYDFLCGDGTYVWAH